ncbi:tyrosine-type recombinase/integrase [Faecalitalea cylindroides]|uniref:tyrosine-type recombinase/integrase n=1 Tax=Faecalitalea cylindroides TaxID=39483 RepID=UPI002490300D|nr:site-specific integrase [Faecalitalea cylindroides]
MKYIIEEVKSGKGRYFRKIIKDDENRIIRQFDVKYTSCSTVIDDMTYYILYDGNMRIVESVYKYINVKYKNASNNTKILYMKAIKQLYEFAAICECRISELTIDQLNQFQYFLRGYETGSRVNSIYMYTGKSKKDVYKYISICQAYMKYCRFSNHKMLDCNLSNSVKNANQKNFNCPKFISYLEMEQILTFIDNDSSLCREEKLKYKAVYMLMEYSGLRIGEVLGLTIEDLKISTNSLGETLYTAIIRNRATDSSNQQAKTCLTVQNFKDYNSSEYKTKQIGWQEVLLNEETYYTVTDYFDTLDSRLRKDNLHPTNADCVENHEDKNFRNYYIFTNKLNNKPLNIKCLSNYTKKVFKACGIQLDKDVRENNLFHRFRHGFSMHLLYEKKMPASIVIQYTRHTSTRSLEPYNNPTNEQLGQLLLDLENENLTNSLDNLF